MTTPIQSVRAMVMAAGAGTRLRPLTFDVPKPMVPVANRPVLEYTIENLRRHGITDIVMNLHSHPEMIREHFKDGSSWGVSITYSHERSLLGTAGGVRKVAPFLKGGTFLVMSGDGLTGVDLSALLSYHTERQSSGTMALKAIDSRFDYGVTLTDRSGKIQKFVEKPLWSDVFSNQVNTGIYVFEPHILSRIPVHRVTDFGKDVWPKLLKERERLFGFAMKEYWCDVGNLSEYRKAQCDVLDGRVGLPVAGRLIKRGVWIDEGTVIEKGARLDGPCVIGKKCRIARGAVIGAYTVIGHNARIGRGAHITHSTLWNNVQVDQHVKLENCIIGHRARVKENISVFEGSVINLSR